MGTNLLTSFRFLVKKAKTLSSYDKHQKHAGPSWIFRIGRSCSGTPARHVRAPKTIWRPSEAGDDNGSRSPAGEVLRTDLVGNMPRSQLHGMSRMLYRLLSSR